MVCFATFLYFWLSFLSIIERLVFYNPYSGYGEGDFVFHQILRPVFAKAGIHVNGLKTEGPGTFAPFSSSPWRETYLEAAKDSHAQFSLAPHSI